MLYSLQYRRRNIASATMFFAPISFILGVSMMEASVIYDFSVNDAKFLGLLVFLLAHWIAAILILVQPEKLGYLDSLEFLPPNGEVIVCNKLNFVGVNDIARLEVFSSGSTVVNFTIKTDRSSYDGSLLDNHSEIVDFLSTQFTNDIIQRRAIFGLPWCHSARHFLTGITCFFGAGFLSAHLFILFENYVFFLLLIPFFIRTLGKLTKSSDGVVSPQDRAKFGGLVLTFLFLTLALLTISER